MNRLTTNESMTLMHVLEDKLAESVRDHGTTLGLHIFIWDNAKHIKEYKQMANISWGTVSRMLGKSDSYGTEFNKFVTLSLHIKGRDNAVQSK